MEWNKHKKFPISKFCIDTLNRVHFHSSRRDYVAIVSYSLCTLYSIFIFYIPIFLLPIPVSISLQQVCRLHCYCCCFFYIVRNLLNSAHNFSLDLAFCLFAVCTLYNVYVWEGVCCK